MAKTSVAPKRARTKILLPPRVKPDPAYMGLPLTQLTTNRRRQGTGAAAAVGRGESRMSTEVVHGSAPRIDHPISKTTGRRTRSGRMADEADNLVLVYLRRIDERLAVADRG